MKDYRRILVFGHSIVHGIWDEEKGGWVERLRQHMYNDYLENQKYHWDENYCNLYNMGVIGEDSEQLKLRIEEELKRRTKEEISKNLVVLQLGINDAQEIDGERRSPLEQSESNMEEIIDSCKSRASRVVLVEEGFIAEDIDEDVMEGELSNQDLKKYEEVKKKVAERKSVDFFNLRDEINREEWLDNLEDGIHPNSQGHERIFNKIKEEIEELV